MTQKSVNKLIYFLVIIALFISSFLIEKKYYSHTISQIDLQKIQEQIDYKGNQQGLIAGYLVFLLDNGDDDSFYSIHEGVQNVELDFEFTALVYKNNKLIYWSDNSIEIPETLRKDWKNNTFTHLPNGWYLNEYAGTEQYDIFVLSVIKNDYSITNNYLKNRFTKGIKPSGEVDIVIDPTLISTAIFDFHGNYIFSLSSSEVKKENNKTWPSILLYLIAFILLISGLTNLITEYIQHKILALFTLFVLLFALRLSLMFLQIPIIFYEVELFQPFLFGTSIYIPTLGDFLMHLLFVTPFIGAIHKYSKKTSIKKPINKIQKGFIYIISAAFLAVFCILYKYFVSILSESSRLNFELFNSFSIDKHTLFGLLVLILLTLCFVFIIDIISIISRKILQFKYLAPTFMVLVILFYISNILDIFSGIILSAIILNIIYFRIQKRQFSHRSIILEVLLLSFFVSSTFSNIEEKKETESMHIRSISLGTERDHVAEFLFNGLTSKVEKNKKLQTYLQNYYNTYDDFYKYLDNKIYNGYLGNYEIHITLCDTTTNLYLKDFDENRSCYLFFDDIIRTTAIQLEEPGFYFLNNSNGRISYLHIFNFFQNHKPVKLYIELDSKFESQEIGYPDLLIQGEIQESKLNNSEYAFANYKNNELISQSGEVKFPLVFDFNEIDSSEFSIIDRDNIKYSIYHKNSEETIVLASKQTSLLNKITNFTYFLLIFYISYMLGSGIHRMYNKRKLIQVSFRNRIIIPFIGLLLFAFIIIAVAIYSYVFYQFEQKNISILKEKIASIQVEMEHELSNEKDLDPEMGDYLFYLLNRLSIVFNTDINFYGMNGRLIASSRGEIFDKGLTGTKMNALAYSKMNFDELMEFIQNESVGNLEYFSIYVPFINSYGKKLGYINVPYFSKQETLTEEINKLLAAALNIYVILLFFSVMAAILVSTQIAKPLTLIKNKLKKVQLGKVNELITYKQQDEVGVLIQEYNRMVEEIEKSAQKLADNERELAWREMAKQVAHEIKNPLTPMKLRLQYLKRAWDEQEPDFDERFERFTHTMVEQIESLSSIATAFSNFAKLREPQNEVVNISGKVESVIGLYSETDQINVDHNIQPFLYAFIDSEQYGRVLLNLLKNAVQAIGNKPNGKISVTLEKEEGIITLIVADNGKGIAEDVQEKIFKPNFTTKSSGMGLGLAISKKVIENAGGKISFSTVVNTGTIFYVKVPEYKLI